MIHQGAGHVTKPDNLSAVLGTHMLSSEPPCLLLGMFSLRPPQINICNFFF